MRVIWAWRFLKRDTKSFENTLLALVLLLSVITLSSVGFLTQRVERGMLEKAHEVLAADLRLESGRFEQRSPYVEEAKQRGLEVAQTVSLNSIVHTHGHVHLINLVAAQKNYPLRGQIFLSDFAYGPTHASTGLPKEGEVWLDPKLMAEEQIRLGEVVRIGERDLSVSAVLASRPDQGGGFGDLAPTALIADETLSSLQLLTPSSRLTQAFLFKGSVEQISNFENYLQHKKSVSEKLVDVEQNNQTLSQSIARARHFFNLTTVMTLSLCLVGLMLATKRYIQRHWSQVALLKVLGMNRRAIAEILILELLFLGIAVGVLGLLIGFGLSSLVAHELSVTFSIGLPAADFQPAAVTFLSLGLMLIGFSWPSLKTLADAPIILILRRDALLPLPSRLAVIGFGLVATALILALLLKDIYLIGWAVVGLVASSGIFFGFAHFSLYLLGSVTKRFKAIYRLLSVRLNRDRSQVAIEIMALSLGLTGLLILGLTRQDILEQWAVSLPKETPNVFMINIAKDAHDPFVEAIKPLTTQEPHLMPWVRGRLISVNGHAPTEDGHAGRVRGLAQREQNISIARELPLDNTVIAGQFWSGIPSTPQVSVASEFQESLGLNIGDRLLFDIAGESVEATLSNVRQVRWNGFKPNFFLLFSPGVIEDSVGSYMTSVYLPEQKRPYLESMLRQFPTVTVFDVDAILAQIRSWVERAAMAIQWTFGFTLIAGILVMFAMFQTTLDERHYETALLRSIGVSRLRLWRASLVEFAIIGFTSATAAVVVSAVLAAWISKRVFEFSWHFHPLAYGMFLLAAVIAITLAGALASAWVVYKTPRDALLQYQDG